MSDVELKSLSLSLFKMILLDPCLLYCFFPKNKLNHLFWCYNNRRGKWEAIRLSNKSKRMGKCIMYENVSILSFQKQQNNVSMLFPLAICEHIGILPCYFFHNFLSNGKSLCFQSIYFLLQKCFTSKKLLKCLIL